MPSQIHPALYWTGITATVAVFGWWVGRYAKTVRARPHFEQADVVFQEWFASGCSQKNILTKLGGARNCLRLVVTKRFLWVTSWFPFSLIAPFYDMEHLIPLDTIVSVRRSSFLGRRTFLLTYRDSKGDEHTLRLLPPKPDDFIGSLGAKIEHETFA
jgi:hypothetical protein